MWCWCGASRACLSKGPFTEAAATTEGTVPRCARMGRVGKEEVANLGIGSSMEGHLTQMSNSLLPLQVTMRPSTYSSFGHRKY